MLSHCGRPIKCLLQIKHFRTSDRSGFPYHGRRLLSENDIMLYHLLNITVVETGTPGAKLLEWIKINRGFPRWGLWCCMIKLSLQRLCTSNPLCLVCPTSVLPNKLSRLNSFLRITNNGETQVICVFVRVWLLSTAGVMRDEKDLSYNTTCPICWNPSLNREKFGGKE